jgi:hypothetical protein
MLVMCNQINECYNAKSLTTLSTGHSKRESLRWRLLKPKLSGRYIMKTGLVHTRIITASIMFLTAVSGSAFARGSAGGGIGPAGPVGYSWVDTQQGQHVERVAAERQDDRNPNSAYGGSNDATSQSGMRSSNGYAVNGNQ